MNEGKLSAVSDPEVDSVHEEGGDRQTFLLRLSDALRPLGESIAIQEEACRLLGRYLGVSRVLYAEFRVEDGREYVVIDRDYHAEDAVSSAGKYPADEFGPDIPNLRAGRSVAVSDTESLAVEEHRAAWQALGVRAYIGVPLIKDGRLVVGFGAHNSSPRTWTENEKALIQETAERTWAAVERARAESALRESESNLRRTKARLDSVLEAGLAGTFYWDIVRDRVTTDENMRRYFSLSEAALTTGVPLSEVLPAIDERDRPAVAQALGGALEETGHYSVEYRINHSDGSQRWLSARGEAERDESGAVVGLPGFAVDITRIKQAEELLRRNADTFHNLIEHAPFGTYVIDADFRIAQASQIARGAFGNVGSLIGRDLAETLRTIWPEPFASEAIGRFRHTLATGEPFVSPDTVERRADKDAVEAYDWRIERIVLPDGTFGVVCYFYDLTERQRLEAALRHSQERLRALVSATSYVIYRMSPDWKEMRQLDGRGFVVDTTDPSKTWLDVYIAAEDQAAVLGAIGEAIRTKGVFDLEHRVRRIDGSLGWTHSRAVPLLDSSGEIVEWIGAASDVTERREAEAALRESEKRYRALVSASNQVLYRHSPDWSEMRQLAGGGFLADTESPDPDWFNAYIHPQDQTHVWAAIQEAIRTKSVFELEHRVIRADGTLGWTLSRSTPILDEDGDIVEWFGAAGDVTARREAEEKLRESEERLRKFGEASSDVLWIRDAETLQWEYLTPAFETVYGASREAALSGNNLMRWIEMIVPEDRVDALAKVRRVREGERITYEYRIKRPSDGEIRWMSTTDFPLFDAEGRVERIAGIGHDVTEEKKTRDRMQVLVAELQHRTRNLIGVVRSLADRTVENSSSLTDFRERFRDRLGALARVNGLLSRLNEGRKVAFDEVLRAELAAHGAVDESGHGPHVTLDGPMGIKLRSTSVQTFALALHELATNADKYGALSVPEGHLTIRWWVESDGTKRERLYVEWQESGVHNMPEAEAQTLGNGYGRELIEKALPYQLDAETRFEFGSDGVRCRIVLPITPEGETGLETAGTRH